MRILILGGDWFLSRAFADAFVAAGNEVTVFNRGRSGVDPEGVVAIRGDRESDDDLSRLTSYGPWDAVIDPSGQVPATVLASARILRGSGRYLFVSSVSAYTGWPIEPLTEASPVLDAPPDAGPEFGANDSRGYPTKYGFLKAGYERAVGEVFGSERSVILSLGVILGPWEYVGRLPWWLRRVERGSRVLAPGQLDRPIQPVDVRDVAQFAVTALTTGLSGTFNIIAPMNTATFGSVLQASCQVTGSKAVFEWVDDEFLLAEGVRQRTENPTGFQVSPTVADLPRYSSLRFRRDDYGSCGSGCCISSSFASTDGSRCSPGRQRRRTPNCWCFGTRSPCCVGATRGRSSTGPTVRSSPHCPGSAPSPAHTPARHPDHPPHLALPTGLAQMAPAPTAGTPTDSGRTRHTHPAHGSRESELGIH